jgi:hypothetical protein
MASGDASSIITPLGKGEGSPFEITTISTVGTLNDYVLSCRAK